MGSRKLKYFIENPLLDINKINKRYDIVSKLLEEFILSEELRNDLYEVYDLERYEKLLESEEIVLNDNNEYVVDVYDAMLEGNGGVL